MSRKANRTDDVSKLCEILAKKHSLPVPTISDLVEDVRRATFNAFQRSSVSRLGLDIYLVLYGGAEQCCTAKLSKKV